MILNCFSAVPVEIHPERDIEDVSRMAVHTYSITPGDSLGSGVLSPTPGCSRTSQHLCRGTQLLHASHVWRHYDLNTCVSACASFYPAVHALNLAVLKVSIAYCDLKNWHKSKAIIRVKQRIAKYVCIMK